MTLEGLCNPVLLHILCSDRFLLSIQVTWQNDPVSLSPSYSTSFDFILVHLYELVMPTLFFQHNNNMKKSLDCDHSRWLANRSLFICYFCGPLLGITRILPGNLQYCFFPSLDLLKLVVQALCNQSLKNWFLAPSTFILTLILLISPLIRLQSYP